MTAYLSLDGIDIRRSGRTLLDRLDLAIEEGSMVALVGPNGSGKTTLLRVLLALERADRGRVSVAGSEVGVLSMNQRAALMAWLPQKSPSLEALTVIEIVAGARYRFDEPRSRTLEVVHQSLARVEADDLGERRIDQLSGGESQRVAMATLLAQQAKVWLVDEPANHLDPSHQVRIYRFLGEQVAAGTTVVCVTHDVNLLRHARVSGVDSIRIVGLKGGAIAFDSTDQGCDLGVELSNLFGVEHRPHGDGSSGIWIVGGEGPS